MKTIFTTLCLMVVTSIYSETAAQLAPAVPGTGPMTVQMFQGGTTSTWIALYPPTTYADGTPIPNGKAVSIRVYRSSDYGATYPTPVKIESGGKGFVGQGAAGSTTKPWIDLKLSTPVDNRAPYLVFLAATAVIDGVESPVGTTANLTFRYYPGLERFAAPTDATGTPAATAASGNGNGPLGGNWSISSGGSMQITETGNQVSGSITADGVQLATLSGTRDGNTYNLRAAVSFEGYSANVGVQLTVSGNRLTARISHEGEVKVVNGTISGRTISVSG